MKQSKEFAIEIGMLYRSGLDLKSSILGIVYSKPGEYKILPEINVRVCRVIYRPNLPAMQKVIFAEEGYGRRTAFVHHNANGPVIQDLSPSECLTFRIKRICSEGRTVDKYE